MEIRLYIFKLNVKSNFSFGKFVISGNIPRLCNVYTI